MMRQRRLSALLLCTLALPSCRDAAPVPAEPLPETFRVDATWLSRHGADPRVLVLHVAPDSAAHEQAFIPGSRFLPLSTVALERDGVPNELPPLDEVRAAFEDAGVGDSTFVVLYGEPLHAARAFMALDVLGHARLALLDGGHAAWHAAGAQSVTAAPAGPGRITARPRSDVVADADHVRERIGRKGVLFLDARPEPQFATGHLPGAASLYWEHTLISPADPRLLPTDELHALFDNAGGDLATELILYCRSGMQAGFLYYAARHLGYDVRLYDGSLADWTSRSLPVDG
jgi:thiosulfate/3-mercaptopyruvate sulfurtransferase